MAGIRLLALAGSIALQETIDKPFIAPSSYIYINGFGLSVQVYSYYLAINAIGMILGPMLYMRVSRKFNLCANTRRKFDAGAAKGRYRNDHNIPELGMSIC